MDTDDATPATPNPRPKVHEREDKDVRMLRLVITAAVPLILSLAGMFLKTWSDNRDADKKAAAIVQTTTTTTTDVVAELAKLKAQNVELAKALQATSTLAVETHEDAPKPGKRRARPPADPKLLKQVQDSIGVIRKVEAKARAPVAVQVPPPDKGAATAAGAGGATQPPGP